MPRAIGEQRVDSELCGKGTIGVSDFTQSAEMFGNRLRKNARHRHRWARRRGISCYRLYDRDIPEIPLAVDWYEGRLHIAEYLRPGSPEGDAHSHWLTALLERAGQVLEVPDEDIFLKQRARQRGSAQYGRFGRAGARFEVQESGLHFVVNLSDYLDTGLFLDHRNMRQMVREEAQGKRVLNLFAYTGAFTVHALAGGAQHATNVDLSNTYSDWTRENLRLNQLSAEVVRADVMTWLAACRPNAYDLAVVDPPTFSNSKRTENTFDVQRDHIRLLQSVFRVVVPGGSVYFSTNARRFRLDGESLPGVQTLEITRKTIPDDFRNQRIHQAFRMVTP